jgi:phosphohistidine phosphatase
VRLLGESVAVWSSPYARALRTAELFARAMGHKDDVVEVVDALAPSGAWRALEQRATRVRKDGTVVWVGHEPDLGQLAARFAIAPGATLQLKKAGACALTFDGVIRAGEGTLEWLLPPKALRALGRLARKG